jgi:hypothetical protein
MAIEKTVLKYFIAVIRFFFHQYRKLGLSDYQSTVFFFSLGVVALAGMSAVLIFQYALAPLLWAMCLFSCAISLCFIFLYINRLRRNGIVLADVEAEHGIDYKSALNLISTDFNFLGVGASKLTAHKLEFDEAVRRVVQHNSKVRLLLCDPRCKSIRTMEKMAGADQGQFLVNVQKSFRQLEQVWKKYDGNLQIKLYSPAGDSDFPPFRIFIANNDNCLVSPLIFGAAKEGKSLQQIQIAKSSGPLSRTGTLFLGFQKIFEQLWDSTSIEINDGVFNDIRNLNN